MTTLEEGLTEQELAFLWMVKRGLLAERRNKTQGEAKFTAVLRDGGIMDQWREIKAREKFKAAG